MTTKTSLFNKGIYKSTVKRYMWGSIVYFALLFLSTVLALLLRIDTMKGYNYGNGLDHSLLFDFLESSMLLALVVPTVTGLLIFRFVHSKKASVFTHSLPTNRIANYISSVCAGLTLMFVPIIINTLILMLVQVNIGEGFFTIGNCLTWMAFNMLSVFMMFSCTCFVSFITGNGIAMVVLNIFVYVFPLVISSGISNIAEIFLYGYPGGNHFTRVIEKYLFPNKIISISSDLMFDGSAKITGVFTVLIIALILYVLAAVLYSKRNMEKVGDVASFKVLNPVLKYLATFTGAVFVFAALDEYAGNRVAISSIVALVVCAIIYFGTEMLLKKSTNVWSSFKGFVVFAVVIAALVYLVSGTSFFGYETRIPESDQINGVCIGDYYSRIGYLSDEEAIETVRELHKEFLDDKIQYGELEDDEWPSEISVKYKLKNGNILTRTYLCYYDKVMERLYEVDSFKKAAEPIFATGLSYVGADIFNIDDPVIIEDPAKAASLAEALRKDIQNIDYDNMDTFGWKFNIQIRYNEGGVKSEDGTSAFQYIINANFKETINWIKENGYWDRVKINHMGPVVLEKCDEYEVPYRDYEDLEIILNSDKVIVVAEEKCEALYELIYTTLPQDVPKEKEYLVFAITDEKNFSGNLLAIISEDQVNQLME